MLLPADMIEKIHELFRVGEEQEEVKKLLEQLDQHSLNIGPEQLARSILVLSEGKVEKIKNKL